jgi:cell division protein FtsW (lipid II flippase)
MPFISYGGTNMIFSAAAIGILLNISKYTEALPKNVKVPLTSRFAQ